MKFWLNKNSLRGKRKITFKFRKRLDKFDSSYHKTILTQEISRETFFSIV